MQYTENYSLREPQAAETASYQDINYNTRRIDGIMADNRQISVAMYVSGNTYNTGDLVGYENPSTHHIKVYRCLVDNVTGVWDSTKWTLTNLAAEIIDAKQSGGTEVIANPTGTAAGTLNTVKIDDVIYEVGGDSANQNIADAFSELQTYAVGEYCIYESILYKCTTAVTTAGAWDSTKWQSCVVTDEMGSGGGGSSTFAGLTDVDFTNLTDEDFAQYDASSQKWKNVAISGVSVQPLIYSDDEIEVGVWRDGKPLYQKSFVFTQAYTIGNGWTNIVTLSGVDNLYNATLYRINNNGTYLIGSEITPSDGKVYINTFLNSLTCNAGSVLTIQYTKTNDTAGSGTWTPSGVPTVHYSTSEHIVGTWIDGKTVYEKTVNFGVLPNNTSKSVAHGISNLDYIVKDTVVAKSNSGSIIPIPFNHRSTLSSQIQISYDATNIIIATGADQSTYNTCYVTLQYIKSSS